MAACVQTGKGFKNIEDIEGYTGIVFPCRRERISMAVVPVSRSDGRVATVSAPILPPPSTLASVPGMLQCPILVIADQTIPDVLISRAMESISKHPQNEIIFSSSLSVVVECAIRRKNEPEERREGGKWVAATGGRYDTHQLILVVSNDPRSAAEVHRLAGEFPGKRIIWTQSKSERDAAPAEGINVVELHAHEILRVAERLGVQ